MKSPISTYPLPYATHLAVSLLFMAFAPSAGAAGVVKAANAASCVGRVCNIEGLVASVATATDNTTVVSLGRPDARRTFSAVISADSAPQFHTVLSRHPRKVRVTGLVQMRDGRPETVLNHASQLVSVD